MNNKSECKETGQQSSRWLVSFVLLNFNGEWDKCDIIG